MGIRFERKTILAKIEGTYGVDPTPTGAANAVLLRNVDIDIAGGDRVPRDIIRTGMGQVAQFLFGRRVTLTATIDLAGAGAAGTAPAYGPLLRACGMAEAISAGVKVDYSPIDSAFESVALYFNIEGNRTIMLGTRGAAKWMLPRGKLPQIQLTLTGLWVSDTAVAYPTQTLTAWKDPVLVSKANTPTFTINSVAVIAANAEIDNGMQVAYRELVNLQEVNVQDRQPTFMAQIEEPAIGTTNWFALMAGASVPFDIIQGTVAGNIIEFTSSTLQILDVKRAADQNVAMLNITGNIRLGSPDFNVSVK